jgi:hypothetical protein
MVQDNQRIRNAIRDPSPCKGCTERFTACYDRCPKDDRGEYGYNSWKAEIARVKKEKHKYLNLVNNRWREYNEVRDYGEK